MFDYAKDTGQLGVSNETLIPHPDGAAWAKCCKDACHRNTGQVSCAFVRNQENGARLTTKSRGERYDLKGPAGNNKVQETPFFCCHRSTDDGYYRVCAGWDACFGNKSLAVHD